MRTRTKQGGREGRDEASAGGSYSTVLELRGLLAKTGRLIYRRDQGVRSRVESQREGVYTEYRTLSIYGKGEDRKRGNQTIARQSNCENDPTESGRGDQDQKRKVILMMQVARHGDHGNQSIQDRKSHVAMIGGGHSHCETRLMGSRRRWKAGRRSNSQGGGS